MGIRKNNRNQNPTPDRRNPKPDQSGQDTPASQPSAQARIWQVVALIPAGKVATYGQVAALAGMPSHARLVGRTLAQLPADTRLPWHRVVNAGLKISLRDGGRERQRQRLRAERVEFIGERVARRCRWEPS